MTQPHICAVPGCGEPIPRRPGETSGHHKARKTCSEPCRVKSQRLAKTGSIHKPVEPVRICALPGCDNPLVRRPTEGNAQWKARKCCSGSCAKKLKPTGVGATRVGHPRLRLAVMGRPAAALLCCTSCGVEMPKPEGMSWGKYRGRSTCGSDKCKHATSRKAVGAPKEREMKAISADLMLSVTPRHLQAYLLASADERRLFAPHIAAIAEARMGRG